MITHGCYSSKASLQMFPSPLFPSFFVWRQKDREGGETLAENHLLGWLFKGRSDGCDARPVDVMESRGFAIFLPAGVGGWVVLCRREGNLEGG